MTTRSEEDGREEWTASLHNSLKEHSAAEIVGRAVRLYVASPHHFVIPFLVSGIVRSILFGYLNQVILDNIDPTNLLMWITSNVTVVTGAVVLLLFIEWINVVASGMVVKTTLDLVTGNHASLKKTAKHTLRKLPALMIAGLLTSVLSVIGLLLFIIPGVILIVIFSFVAPAIMIEGRGGLESLRRSRQLVAHCRGTTFLVQLLTFMISTSLMWLLITIEVPLGPLSPIISTIVSAFVQPIKPIAITILFYAINQNVQTPTRQISRGVISFCPQCGAKLNLEDEGCPSCGS